VARDTSRAGRVILGLAALAVLAILLAGAPLVLVAAWRYLGPPWPSWQDLTSPDDGTVFVRVLCLIGWLGWLTFAWSVLAELAARVLGWRLPALRWQQRMAAGLVAAVALSVNTPTVAGATALPVRAAPVVVAPAVQSSIQVVPAAPVAGPAAADGYLLHRVQPGEQMPAIAERYLGDKYQWHDIASATYGMIQPDGRTLRPGDTRVYPGWTVRVPARPATTAGLTHAARDTAAHAPPAAPVYEVARGDWLWHIADRFLGDPNRYLEIEALNPGLEHRDGRFPDHIEATWRMVLPTDAHDRGPRVHATGSVLTAAPQATRPGTGATPAPGRSHPGTDTHPGRTPSIGPSARSAGAIASPSPAASPSDTASQAPSSEAAQHSRGPATAAPAPPASNGHQLGEDDSMLDQVLLIGVPLLGAGLLAALLLTILRRNRRRQEQHRPVGRRLPAPAEPKVETQLRVVAQPVAVERLDHALRTLAGGLADRPAEQMPDIVGTWLHGNTVNLLLTNPCPDPPPPWIADHLNWTLPGDIELSDVDGQLAPLPTLAAVGSQPGMHLLLDLERLGVVTITGDQGRAADLLRYLAAELACNLWSDHAEITVAGFDAAETGELIALGGERIGAAPSIGAAIERIRRRASQVIQALDHLGADDPFTGRIADIAADAWMPQVLLAMDPSADEIAALEALDSDLSATGRCAVAVAVTTTHAVGRWPISVDANGRLTVPFLGMTGDDTSLTAAGLPRTELGSLADLLDTARRSKAPADPARGADRDDSSDWPSVPPAPEVEPWARGTDATGALLPEPDGEPDLSTDNAAPPPPRTEAGSSTAGDEATRIPPVVPTTGPQRPAAGRYSDPTLDADVRAWIDADPIRPRIAILGPVTVEAPGQPPSERLRFYAEIIVYLASRGGRGATTDEFDEALWPAQQVKATSRRVAIARARRWLGETAEGEPWLPDATSDRRYHLRDGYLLDWHLFRRLRSRGESRGPDGADDLRQALALVRGEPLAGADIAYSPVARNPYVWLPTSDIQPHHLAAAVVDTAHRLVELCLEAGDVTGARWAVDQARMADPDRNSDIAWRDLLRVAAAEGNKAELDQILGDLIRVREAEVPEDLDKDTYRLLCDLMPERIRAGVR
jgi:nucleoid-associated protein YgaU